MISNIIYCCVQNCMVLLVPYPNNPNPVESFNIKTDFDLHGGSLVWYARSQLFFNCTLCSTDAKWPGFSASHNEVSLVYFSTFEPIDLTPDRIMQQARVPMLYDLASNQRLPCPCSERAGERPPHSLFHRGQQSPRTIGVLEAPPPTRSGTGAAAAGFAT